MRYRYVALIGLAAATGVMLFWMTRPPTLTFRPVATPEGFRELVVANGSSTPDALLALVPSGVGDTEDAADAPGDLTLCDALFRDPASPTLGDPDSALTIVEFFDYRCPYCRTLSEMLLDIQASRPGIRIVFKEWLILSEGSVVAARAALAAGVQGRYEAFHRRMMSARLIPTRGYVEDVARALGMDADKLLEDMNAEVVTVALERTSSLAAAMGFAGTPVLLVGRTVVKGAIDDAQLDQLVSLELSATPAKSC